MKKILLSLGAIAVFITIGQNVSAQKNKVSDSKSKEIIIVKDHDKDTKLTIETKDGKTFINGKPASEYKDDNVSVITGNDGNSFMYSTGRNRNLFTQNWNGEKKAFLGITTEKTDKGLKVTDVEDGSAAEKAGLKEGDIITKIGDKKVSDPDELSEAVTSHKPKDEVKVYYERNGKSNDVKATLGESDGMFGAFSFNGPDVKMKNDLLKNYNKSFKGFNNNMMPLTIAPGAAGRGFRYSFGGGNRRLGVRIEDAENDGGATITNVEEESNAAKAGLKKDDVITEVNGKKVKNVDEALEQVRDNSEKSSYNIKAKRNGSEMSFEIKIPKPKNNADL